MVQINRDAKPKQGSRPPLAVDGTFLANVILLRLPGFYFLSYDPEDLI